VHPLCHAGRHGKPSAGLLDVVDSAGRGLGGFASDGVHGGESDLVTTATETPPPTNRRGTVDLALAGAVEIARDAAVALAGAANIGEHLGVHADGERLVTHDFACLDQAYRGWRWAVTLTRASRSKTVTVDEAVLLPGPDSLLAPEWVPWSDRLKPGDLGVGDLLITEGDDDRLEPGYAGSVALGERVDEVADEIDRVAVWELGLGRARVLSPIGRDDATDRWYAGDRGPTAPIALAAPAPCSTCGFFLPLAGSMRRVFGVCANEFSPGDGTVVSVDHGCGAHSEVAVLTGPIEVTPPGLDDLDYDVLPLHPVEQVPGSVDDEAPPEDLGHS
jgi:Protein of unknown function (DUF3027)